MTADYRTKARASARAAAERAHAMRRESDALWLSGDKVGARDLESKAQEMDAECNAYCKIAAVQPPMA